MDTFLRDICYELFYSWIRIQFKNSLEEVKESYFIKLTINIDSYDISVFLWENLLVEEIVIDTNNNVVFYVHYQFLNFLQGKTLMNALQRFIKSLQIEKNILLICSCGITTSIFAEKLEKQAKERNLKLHVQATNLYALYESNLDKYDVLYIAPQVAYLIPEIQRRINKELHVINTSTFATNNASDFLVELERDFMKQ